MSADSAARPLLPAAPPRVPPSREERLATLARERFDVLVIGGGATGAGVARDAALRGLRVALVERDDFASGTSSRSSRLIHGGLRYLEHGHLGLVFESSIERRRLLSLAPHLVRPLGFLWPVYAGARVPRWKLNAGLMLYDALALFRNVRPYQPLGAAALHEAEPLLRRQGLEGGARYWDAATDDARLTLANALGALEAGACVVNHARVHALHFEAGRARGARVVDGLGGRELTVGARVVVNATGPWSDEIRRLDEGEPGPPAVRGTKGVHLAVPRERLGNREALTVTSPVDGRVMFILPAGRHAIVGTTETATRAHPAEVRASEADVAYLLESANHFFPAARLAREDVVSAWAGIRPLAAQAWRQDGSARAASREHTLQVSPSGVVAISGGKLTTYRLMARDVVDRVERELGLARGHRRRTPTEVLPLPGGDLASLEAERARARSAVGREDTAEHLVRAYGSRWGAVWELARQDASLAAPLEEGLPYVLAEVRWAVTHELAHTPADLLVRRLKVAFETRDQGRAAARRAATLMGPLLGWDEAHTARALEAYALEADRVFRVEVADT